MLRFEKKYELLGQDVWELHIFDNSAKPPSVTVYSNIGTEENLATLYNQAFPEDLVSDKLSDIDVHKLLLHEEMDPWILTRYLERSRISKS